MAKVRNELGLVGKIQGIHDHLQARRIKGEDLTLSTALKAGIQLSENGTILKDITFDKLLCDLGIDKNKDTVQAILDLPEDQRWIVPELFLEIIEQGMRQNNEFYQALIAGTISQNTLTFNQPEIGVYSEADQGLNAGGIGSTPEDGTQVTFGTRSISTEKFERKIGIPHEVTKYSTIAQLQIFLTRQAKVWGLQLTRRAINVILNGDKKDGTLAAGTIGVETPASNLQWIDLTRIHVRMNRLGFMPTTVISTEDGTIHVVNLPEFKDVQSGRVIGEARLQGRLPNTWDFYTHSAIAAGKYVFLDPAFTCQELVSEGLRVESDRLANRDLTETYVRVQQGYANIYREARVIVDESVSYTVFPAFMDPID